MEASAAQVAMVASEDPPLDRLVREAATYSAEFPEFLANHLPMVLVALRRLGAGDARLAAFSRFYVTANGLVPPPPNRGRIDAGNWREHLGDRAYEGDYRAFFKGEVARLGAAATERLYLPALVPGIAASAIHALMRLAYAHLREDAVEIATALGYWAATWLPLRLAGQAEPVTGDPAALLLRLRPIARSWTLAPPTDLLWHWMREAAARPDFPPLVDWLAPAPDGLAAMARASLALMAGTMSFEALHAVTGIHWLRLTASAWPDADLARRYFWQAIAAVYPKIGMPDLPGEAALDRLRSLPCPDWPVIKAAACRSDDEHDLSFTFSAFEEQTMYGDPLYRVLAARRLGLVP